MCDKCSKQCRDDNRCKPVEKKCECQICFKRWTTFNTTVTCPKCGNKVEDNIVIEEM